jgi:hypothetical protein
VRGRTWSDHGGTTAIRYWNGFLIVKQTPRRHREIARFLLDLKHATVKQ